MTLPQTIADFAGQWRMIRRIEDAAAGQVLHASGSAVIASHPQHWIYDENLTLRVPGQPEMTATRRYLWHGTPDGVRICFDDGRFFHHLSFGTERCSDHHDCAPDSYDAQYDFERWPRWSVVWTVSGPRKSYVMHTDYARDG